MGKKHNKQEKNPNWKGGRYKDKRGYIFLNIPNHPKAKYSNPYIAEHRLIMELFLRRFLKNKEEIHHIDFDKENNNINNLMLFPDRKSHITFHNKIKKFGMTNQIKKQIRERWGNLK